MNIKKNGASLTSIDKLIFAFGGNTQEIGSIDTIERYSIEFDKWHTLMIRLRQPVHDTVAYNIGGGRVVIFGGSVNGQNNN